MPPPEPRVTPRVTLLSKPGCHLCDGARTVIERVCAELGVGFAEIDITGSAQLWSAHHERIPVTLVDGHEIDYWRIREDRLRAALGG